MVTLTKSCSPTVVITANGEVQTHEEAIVYVKELDIFLTHRFCGRARTYGSQPDVFDSLKPCYVMLTFETKIHRLQ